MMIKRKHILSLPMDLGYDSSAVMTLGSTPFENPNLHTSSQEDILLMIHDADEFVKNDLGLHPPRSTLYSHAPQ